MKCYSDTEKSQQIVTALFLYMTMAAMAPALAVDGVIEINQARALAGGVTPGDAPGFPVTIDQPGSYRLTSILDIRGQPNPETVAAIEVLVDNVTLDLNGFGLLGPNNCTWSGGTFNTTPHTVTCTHADDDSCNTLGRGIGLPIGSTTPISLVVHNGFIRGMGGCGIVSAGGENDRIENLTISHNGGSGIFVASSGIYNGNRVTTNRLRGIVFFRGTASDNYVANNGGSGIEGIGATNLSRNTARLNGWYGIRSGHGTATGNTAEANSQDGFISTDSLITANRAVENYKSGFYIISGSVTNNVSMNNGEFGIRVNGNGSYGQNFLDENASGPISGGFTMGSNICTNVPCP